eukprot:332166_1
MASFKLLLIIFIIVLSHISQGTPNNLNDSYCITLKLQIEADNVLPSNSNPNALSNILPIRKAMQNISKGVVTIPNINYTEIDPLCVYNYNISNLPDEYQPATSSIIQTDNNNLTITIPISTIDNIAYKYKISSLPLNISHHCNDNLTMIAIIYSTEHEEYTQLAKSAEVVLISGDHSTKIFPFTSTILLSRNSIYDIVFTLINGYPHDCKFQDFMYYAYTSNPTNDPTINPIIPTKYPTASPTFGTRCWWRRMDLVIAIDTSCPMKQIECEHQQKIAADIFSSLRSTKWRNQGTTQMFDARISYIEFDSTQIYNPIHFYSSFNTNSQLINLNQINMDFYRFIKNRTNTICSISHLSQRQQNPDLNAALFKSVQLFNSGKSSSLSQDKEILIISNCEALNQQTICENYTRFFMTQGINVNMINYDAANAMVDPNTYLVCLVNYDIYRIVEHKPSSTDISYEEFIMNVADSICKPPTPNPTMDPTDFPTVDPTDFPTSEPTSKPTPFPTSPSYSPTLTQTFSGCHEYTHDPFVGLLVLSNHFKAAVD